MIFVCMHHLYIWPLVCSWGALIKASRAQRQECGVQAKFQNKKSEGLWQLVWLIRQLRWWGQHREVDAYCVQRKGFVWPKNINRHFYTDFPVNQYMSVMCRQRSSESRNSRDELVWSFVTLNSWSKNLRYSSRYSDDATVSQYSDSLHYKTVSQLHTVIQWVRLEEESVWNAKFHKSPETDWMDSALKYSAQTKAWSH